MRTGRILSEDKLDRYRPLGAFGQPVHRSYMQLQAGVRRRLGDRYANFFATPRADPQGRKMSWISPVEGEPVRWTDLSDDDQVSRSLDLQAMKSGFERYIDELRTQASGGQGSGGASAFVSVLEQALRTPDDRHLFFLDDQPIATFWGFRGANSPPFETLAAVPRIPPKIVEEPAAVSDEPTVVADEPAVVAEPVAPERRRFPWWLLLLPLLILLALLLWWLWPHKLPDLGFGGLPAPPELVSEPTLDDSVESLKVHDVDGVDSLTIDRREGEGGVSFVREDAVSERTVSESDVAGEAGAPLDEAVVEPARDEDAAPSAEPTADTVNDGQAPEAVDAPVPEPGPGPEEPTGLAPGTPPVIPDNAVDGAAGFMRGVWQSDSGLVDALTKQKLTQEYTFDEQGRGEAVIRRADGVVCRAPAEATVKAGDLQVDELENLRCTDGSSFRRSRTICTRDSSGNSQCVGSGDDGSRYDVELTRGGRR